MRPFTISTMHRFHLLRVPVLLAALISIPLNAAEESPVSTNTPLLTLERIFASDELHAKGAPSIVWRKKGPGYYQLRDPKDDRAGKDLVLPDPESESEREEIIVPAHAFVPPGESRPLSIEEFEFSSDESKLLLYTNSKRVWRRNTRGDYWVLDITSRELKKLGGDAPPSSLMFAEFSPDGSRVAYVRESNLYVQDLRDMEITPLTTDGGGHLINGTFDWVYEEELDLRKGFRWSPDGKQIAYWQLDTSGVREFFLINNTEGLYSRPVPIPYPKAGEQNSAARVGVVNAGGGETRWIPVPGDPRSHYIARMDWASNSAEIVIQQFNRLQNTNRVMLASPDDAEVRTILTETDAAWVDNQNPIHWIDNGSHFIWLSERSGWRHAYSVSRDGRQVSPIISGDFDVIGIEGIDQTNRWLYFTASPDNATQRYLYKVPLNGGPPERVTPGDQPGTHSYDISPGAQWAVHTYSTFTNPPVVDLIRLPEHRRIRLLEENKELREKLDTLSKPAAEFFRVDIGDEVLLDGWRLLPPDFDPAKKYPLLFHVYGEPAGQTVLDSWQGTTALWHWMLAQQGYVVLSIDNRGTPAPRGRDWRKIIHRQVGILAPADQAAALQALLKQWPWADPARVGIWGWSGGGSMTLNALLQYPDLYHTGIAIAPVPNQRLYDTIYQERYMGLPSDNPDGYRRGSAITYAHQLKGNLLLVHGTGDDNVHYQGLEALINEFISYNKPFTMMAYPNRTHAIREGENTRLHLFSLLTSYLRQNLPVEPQDETKSILPLVENSDRGWRSLGKDDFVNVNCDPDTWTWTNDTVHCTGQPIGVIRSTKPYTNFELSAEWRHLRSAGNSGIFVWATPESIRELEEGKGRLPAGIEVQALDHGYKERYEKDQNRKADWFTTHGDVFPTGKAIMKPFPPVSPNGSRSFPVKNLSKGVGEWNHYYIRCLNGEIRLWVNGEEVSGGSDCNPASGYLCLESEGSPIEFRKLRIRELP